MVHSAIGLGLAISWLWLSFLNGPLLYQFASRSLYKAETLFLLFLFFHSLSFLWIGNHFSFFSQHKRFLRPFGVFAMILSAIITQLLFGQIYTFILTALIILLASFGGAILISSWGETFAKLEPGNMGVAFGGAILLSTVLSVIGLHVPNLGLLFLVLATPLFSYIILQIESPTDQPQAVPTAPLISKNPLPFKLIAILFLFYSAGGFMYKLIYAVNPFDEKQMYIISSATYCLICILAGLAIKYCPHLDLRLLYRPVLPLLGSGFILFPLLAKTSMIPFLLLQTGFALFDAYTWLLFIYLASSHTSPLYIIGWSMFFLTFSMFVGDLLLTGLLTIGIPFHSNMVSLLAAILVLCTSLIFHDRKETFSGWTTTDTPDTAEALPPPKTSPHDEETIEPNNHLITDSQELFCNHYPLTAREKEVVILLLKGRNNPFIRNELNIADSTLKTHLRNIYRKLEVCDRQELVSLYDSLTN